MARNTFRYPDNLETFIENNILEYNDTKSEFFREAAQEKAEREYGYDPSVDYSNQLEAVPDGGTTQ